jgi:NAD(P)-dependent dehydrogenase (short-subunit alcohol dehydrogenase family)
VLVTGASRGIGAEIALQYARAGANLTLVARSQAALDASRGAILRERPSTQLLVFPADVRDVTSAQEVVAATVTHFGRLDVLVANAATVRCTGQRALPPPRNLTMIDSTTELTHP